MKRPIFTFCRLALSVLPVLFLLPVQAQDVEDAFYIYRNDGGFHAFFREDVDSITHSHYDADSLYYDDVVMQVVYTADSIYKIPLASIDSVAFVTPETKYKSEVVHLDPYLPSLQTVDGMNLTFDAYLAGQKTPRVGDILLYENFTDQFPMGFAGRIEKRTSNDGIMTFICDSVSMEEIYDQILCYGSYTAIDAPEADGKMLRLVPKRKISGDGSISTALELKGSVGSKNSPLYLNVDGRLGLDLRLTFKFNAGEEAFFDMSLSPELRVGLEAGAKGKLGGDNVLEKKVEMLTVPIPGTPFLLKYKTGPKIIPQLEASISAKTEARIGQRLGLKYQDGKFRGYGINTSKWFSTPDVDGYVDGSLFAGLSSEVGIYSCGEIFSLKLKNEAGAEFSANLTANIINSDKYKELQKAKFDVNLKASSSISAEAKFLKFFKASTSLSLLNVNYRALSYKLVPSFQKPVVSVNRSSVDIYVEPQEDLLFPVTIGLGVWDKKDVLKQSKYSTSIYRFKKNWPSGEYNVSLNEFVPNLLYTARPLLKLFSRAIVASPEETFIVNATPLTLDVDNVTETSAKVYGQIDGHELLSSNVPYGIGYVEKDKTEETLLRVAEKNENGEFSVNMKGLQPGTTYNYYAYLIADDLIIRGEKRTFTTSVQLCPDENHPHLIDLGLPSGTKWACCNVGASMPENFGGYYAWGESVEKSVYEEQNYKYWIDKNNNGGYDENEYVNIGDSIAGSNYDAAHVLWGGDWQMPTIDQCLELVNNCNWTDGFVNRNGINGQIATGASGASIFLPAAGKRWSSFQFDVGTGGCYWSSSTDPEGSDYVYGLGISSDFVPCPLTTNGRFDGYSVRAVVTPK